MTLDADQRKRILDRIQKCLNLGKSSEPHEAAAALRQAQKMMEAHGISEADIAGAGIDDSKVDCPIQAGKKVPIQLSLLMRLIKKAFGVDAVVMRTIRVSDASWTVHYFGSPHRLPMATYAHNVVYKAMEQAWAKARVDNPMWAGVRGGRGSFQIGWLESIADKIEAIGFTPEEQMALEIRLNATYPALYKTKVGPIALYDGVRNAGNKEGSSFSLHRPMNASERKQLT